MKNSAGPTRGNRTRRKIKKVPPNEEFQNRAGDEPPAVVERGELAQEGAPLAPIDWNFEPEFHYEGYVEIEDYDNTVLAADIDQKGPAVHELVLKERKPLNREAPSGEAPEESLIDPQEHRR